MITFINNAGAAIVSRKIVERTGNIKWLTREEPFAPQDSGWRVLSDRDTAEYLDDPKNMTVVDGGKPFHELVRAFEERQVLANRIDDYLRAQGDTH